MVSGLASDENENNWSDVIVKGNPTVTGAIELSVYLLLPGFQAHFLPLKVTDHILIANSFQSTGYSKLLYHLVFVSVSVQAHLE